MRIYTGYYGVIGKYRTAGLTPIGISTQAPEWARVLNYIKLAPSVDMLKMSKQDYEPLFKEILSKLSPGQVLRDLFDMSKGKDVVLLCYESSNDCNKGIKFCHRYMVSDWLKAKTGQDIKEFVIEEVKEKKKKIENNQQSLF